MCRNFKYYKNIEQINFNMSKTLLKCIKQRIIPLINPTQLKSIVFDSKPNKPIKWTRQYFDFITGIYANCSSNEKDVMSRIKFNIRANEIDTNALTKLLNGFTNIKTLIFSSFRNNMGMINTVKLCANTLSVLEIDPRQYHWAVVSFNKIISLCPNLEKLTISLCGTAKLQNINQQNKSVQQVDIHFQHTQSQQSFGYILKAFPNMKRFSYNMS